MKNLRLLTLLGFCLMIAPAAHAARIGIEIGVGPAVVAGPVYVGPAPVCAYGYFQYYPYACAPYGYYGPSYFTGGVFIGAGPWFHGDRGFRGRPGFYAGRGNYGRFAAPTHPAFRGEVNRGNAGNHFNGGPVRGTAQPGASAPRGGGNFHGGGRR